MASIVKSRKLFVSGGGSGSGTVTVSGSGSGTINTLPKFTAATTIQDSQITDNGTTVSIISGKLAITVAGTITNGSTNDSTASSFIAKNLAGSNIAQFRNDQAALFAGPISINGGIDITYALTITGKTGGAIRLVDSGSNEMWNILNNHKFVMFDTGSSYARIELGSSGLDEDARLYIRNINDTSGKYGVYHTDTTESLVIFATQGNGSIGMGALPSNNALLDLQSTTKAFKVTRVTTTQRNALTAELGMIVYDSTIDGYFGYTTGGGWTQF